MTIMPLILAIDTTTDAWSVALITPDGIKESVSVSPREHTQRLLPMIQQVLEQNEVDLQQLSAVAYGCGPGSFTGLRISLSVAQGLAYGGDLPLVAVSSLQTMAASAVRLKALKDCLIVPVIDARMDEIYWSAHYVNTAGELETLLAEHVSTPEECYNAINQLSYTTLCGVGSGWHYPIFEKINNSKPDVTIDKQFYPLAYDVAELGSALFEAGSVVSPMEAQPTYLRNEISWKKRERIRK